MVSIEQIQPDLYYKLQSEPLFAPIVIFKQRELRTSSEIDERLANLTGDSRQATTKKPGASITVKMPKFRNANANAPGPLSEVILTATIKENPRINIEAVDENQKQIGTGISGEQWAQNVWQIWHGFTLQGIMQTIYAAEVKPTTEFEDLDLLSWDVTLLGTYPLQAPLFIYTPNVNTIGTTVTLTANLGVVPTTNPQPSQVAIWYTTDASFPGSGNPTALPYSAPFTVPHGTIVRWAAYAPGYNGSDVGWGKVN